MRHSKSKLVDNHLLKESNFDKFFEEYYKKNQKERTEYCLQFISSKLRKASVSALVGAGFSLNANLEKSNSEAKYKDWAGLLVNAYKELYPDSGFLKISTPDKQYDEIKKEIQKLGESDFSAEYVKKHGSRESLDLYIENEFSKIDKKNDNLSLHENLLSLGWCDVLTTNWDDLLERASLNAKSDNTLRQVTSAKGLRVSNKARIIKLNGSLRTEEQKDNKYYRFDDTDDYLYVITPDDFENYKVKHEGFSNFMKIKILENSFCLFGFSGHDTNFKYWIKELKSTMQKGGQTEEPNPIILIAPPENKKTYSSEQEKEIAELEQESEEQFLHNNYIVKLHIEDVDTYLRSCFSAYQTIPAGSSYLQKTFIMFQNFLRYLYNNTKTSFDSSVKKNDDRKTIRAIAFANDNAINESEIKSYNKTALFDFQNLSYSREYVSKIMQLGEHVNDWTGETFVFLYKWCQSNFYSLSNLYPQEKIKEIIKHYEDNILPKEKAPEFMELVLKYYTDSGMAEALKETERKYATNESLKDCINYGRAYFYYTGFHYIKLKEFLESWKPDIRNSLYPLYMLRKASLMLEYENARAISDEKRKEIIEILKTAIAECKNNNQLRYFILLSYKQIAIGDNEYNLEETNNLIDEIEKTVTFPRQYVDSLLPSKENDTIKPNSDIRYSANVQIFNSEDNNPLIKVLRIINFFDYTGMYCVGFIHKKDLLNFIKNVRGNEYYSVRIFIKSLQFYGYSSNEEFLRTLGPRIFKYLNQDLLSELLKQVYEVFSYKLKNNQNASVYIYVLTELSKRANAEARKFFIQNFFNLLKNVVTNDNANPQVQSSIMRGGVWGWKIPFEYLLRELADCIDDEKEIAILFKWIIENYIIDEKRNTNPYFVSEFKGYLEAFVYDERNKKLLEKLFKLQIIKDCFNQNEKYCNIISLNVYGYLTKERQNELCEYLKTEYTLRINPYFIQIVQSAELNRKVIELLKTYEILAVNPMLYHFEYYIKALCNTKLLNENDVKKLLAIISENNKKVTDNKEYFKYEQYRYKQIINGLFESVCEIKNITDKKDKEITTLHSIVKKEFVSENNVFFTFKWLYDENLQNFKVGFIDALSFFSHLKQEKKYCYIINIALAKILVQDSPEFEAVLEQFLLEYERGYGNHVFENTTTKSILSEIYKKFSTDIPDCYDDLFIKEQIKRLEKII